MLAGRSRSKTPKRSSASRDRAASGGAAGSGDAWCSPHATPRISSRNSVREVRVIVLHLQLDVFRFKSERRAFLPAGSLDGSEEVADQFICSPEIIGHQLPGAPETVSMVVSPFAWDAMRVVEAQ